MEKLKTDIPAFPALHNGSTLPSQAGLTMRDYFAVKAMQGLMAMERASEFVDDEGLPMDWDEEDACGTLFVHTDFLVEEAYAIADRMMKAREA